jgi:hypothetical protein
MDCAVAQAAMMKSAKALSAWRGIAVRIFSLLDVAGDEGLRNASVIPKDNRSDNPYLR